MFSAVNEAVRGSMLSPLLKLASMPTDSPTTIPGQPADGTQNASDFTLELDEIEGCFTSIFSTAFNFETLQFGTVLVEISHRDVILDALLPATQSTHQFVYRVTKLKHLVLELHSLQDDYGLSVSGGAHPDDIARFDSMLTMVNLELDSLFTMAQACYNKQDETNKTRNDDGVRSYRFISAMPTSPKTLAAVPAPTLPGPSREAVHMHVPPTNDPSGEEDLVESIIISEPIENVAGNGNRPDINGYGSTATQTGNRHSAENLKSESDSDSGTNTSGLSSLGCTVDSTACDMAP
ncbi:hypothetical protein FRC10_000302 [Ceratobasidium sp. 414]|nr:hypothetical protein FRC10_000302 [Ceratobasidium sp. 414]